MQEGLQLIVGFLDCEPIFSTKRVDLAVLDELVGPSNADHRDGAAHFLKCFKDGGPEAAHFYVIFESDEGGDAACVLREGVAINGFDETRIDNGGGEPVALEALGKFACVGDHGAEAEDGNV